VRACAAEAEDARRLACYDRAVGRSASAPAAAAVVQPDAPPAPSPAEKFGYRGAIAREELDRRAAEGETLERLEATVAELTQQPRGQLIVTLDNGQVWVQKAPDALRLRVGDRVAIKSASFGSFLLVAPNNKTTRVVRQR
jgi:hypothetical protein